MTPQLNANVPSCAVTGCISAVEVHDPASQHDASWSGGTSKPNALRYRCIVADPPWRYKSRMVVPAKKCGYTGTEYPTMSNEEIAALAVGELADSEGCHLYMWTTNTHLEASFGIVRAWGFTPKQTLIWCKRPKGVLGFGAFRGCVEFVVFAHRGKREIFKEQCGRTWWEWPRAAHSAKPEAFQDVVESVSPGPYLELFARRQRLGWHSWGNEAHCHVSLGGGGAEQVGDSAATQHSGAGSQNPASASHSPRKIALARGAGMR